MKRLFALAALICVLFTLQARAQVASLSTGSLPDHFYGMGLGFQNSAIPKTSGWINVCTQAYSKMYGCIATDYSGGTTSTRAEAHQMFYQFKGCGLFGTAGAGAATGVTGGVGGSFDAGGVIGCAVPEKLIRQRGIYAVFSGSWNKRNVLEAPDIGTALKSFGSQTVWRFGFGKGW